MNDCDKCSKKKEDLYLVRKPRPDGSIKETWVCWDCYKKCVTKSEVETFEEILKGIPCSE